jgi:Flp pilus assembly protein TadD
MLRFLLGFLFSLLSVLGASPPRWAIAKNIHFEVYSEGGPMSAAGTLKQFEKLRAFFAHNSLVPKRPAATPDLPVRIVAFKSRREYDAFRVRPTADAYYIGSAERSYIVMPRPEEDDFTLAAHEYAHVALRSGGAELPLWLSEGLAELFSTVRITSSGTRLGGAIPGRTQILSRRTWLPLSVLVEMKSGSRLLATRADTELFYAESWALVDLLAGSVVYAPKFHAFVDEIISHRKTTEEAFRQIYGVSLDQLTSQTEQRIASGSPHRQITPPLSEEAVPTIRRELTDIEAGSLMADLMVAAGQLERAKHLYVQLLATAPTNPEVQAALGTVILRQGDKQLASEYWHRAIQNGLRDPALCFRYAALAEEMGLPQEQIERALEITIAERPGFDDARFKLALLESNEGDYEGAIEQLEAMAPPGQSRAFAYWTALSYALGESGRREEAESAAEHASHFAQSAEERWRAASLAYVAKTDLAVRFVEDANGQTQLVTTRIPHGTADFNPFITPQDVMAVVSGVLKEVQCGNGKLTGFVVTSGDAKLALTVADPNRVLIRNGPSEFTCGSQDPRRVTVEFAKRPEGGGIVRGIRF